MLKKYSGLISFFQKFYDATIVVVSWLLAYSIRFILFPEPQAGLLPTFLLLAPVVAIITVYFFYQFALYESQRIYSIQAEVSRILKANIFSGLTLIAVLYFASESRISRATLIIYFILSCTTLSFGRTLLRSALRKVRRRGYNLRHILLVGQGPQTYEFAKTIENTPQTGIKMVGWVDYSSNLSQQLNIPLIELSVREAVNKFKPDSIIIGYSQSESNKTEDILKEFQNDLMQIQILPDLSYNFVGYKIEDFSGIPILNINQPHFTTLDMLIKRLFDFVLSFLGLIILSPLFLILSLLVKISSRGPVFYTQERVGLDGTKFKMLKFRSMKSNSESPSYGWTIENDPRRTKIGTLLRKTSLDELPQLFNVFIGDMSLVGPRPEQTFFVEKFKNEIPAYMLRHKMKAGITGWAQINGWRGDTSLHKRIECDLYYIRNWSIFFDIKIIILTFIKGFINKNAY